MDSEVVKEKIHTEPMLNDPRYITLLMFWWCFSRRRHSRKSILLTGLSDSGKTLLFVRLAYSQYRQTFTSMKENVEEYVTANHQMRIVDLPGQERLRNKFFDQYLYTILVDPVVQSISPPVLILCNKQDQPIAKGSQD
ncbi:Signal recognition particle receptor beta [Operophtera brumata]|uniref:Signal recognition particle receptor subunit beta n=1 Tax=Operophtera brumata TaxID=104452 RepID=A0A0L7L1K7_OPEBR|nr:Signal recognition particle receptor beta [Operophtera brumata]